MNRLISGQSKKGKTVFANTVFKKGEKIIEFKGQLMKRQELPEILTPEDDRYIQVGNNLYLGPSGEYDDLINHSCTPNPGIKIKQNEVILIALKKIQKDEEICFDYSTTIHKDNWEMNCVCREENCRKRIRDFKYLPEEIQQKYIPLGIVPKYILQEFKQK